MFFFFNDTATTEIYTLSLHDALPIWSSRLFRRGSPSTYVVSAIVGSAPPLYIGGEYLRRLEMQRKPKVLFFSIDRKSTRLNSSHLVISYAVFCLKKQ